MTRRVLWLATSILMLASGLVSGQTTSTFNGRVLDQGDVVRTTVTNDEGGYLMPGLEPGTYSVKTELALPSSSTCSTRRTLAGPLPATLAAPRSGSRPDSFRASAIRIRRNWA